MRPETVNTAGGKNLYQLQFQQFQDMVNWPVACEDCGEAAHRRRKYMVDQAAHFMVYRKLKEKKKKHRHIPIV